MREEKVDQIPDMVARVDFCQRSQAWPEHNALIIGDAERHAPKPRPDPLGVQ